MYRYEEEIDDSKEDIRQRRRPDKFGRTWCGECQRDYASSSRRCPHCGNSSAKRGRK